MKRAFWTAVLCVISLIVLAAAGTAWLLATRAGSRLVVSWVLNRYAPAQTLTIGDIEGTLAQGLSFRRIQIEGLQRLPAGTLLTCERLDAKFTPQAWLASPIEARGILLRLPAYEVAAFAERLSGSVFQGFLLEQVQVTGITRLPPQTTVAVQGINVALPPLQQFDPARVKVTVRNGRIFPPLAEPVLFYGDYAGRRMQLKLFSRAVDADALRPVFPKFGLLRTITGTLIDVEARLEGPWQAPELSGTFTVAHLQRSNLAFDQIPGFASLRFEHYPGPLKLYGEIQLRSGTLTSNQTTVLLDPSSLTFTGAPKRPVLALRGNAKIEGVPIYLSLTGTRDSPNLRLTSVPPMAPQRLLVALTTGRDWQRDQLGAQQEPISTDLAQDFIDYFFLGGAGTALASRFGISGVALTFDAQTNRVGVKTRIADRVSVRYETDQLSAAPEQDPTHPSPVPQTGTQKVGAEYQVTDNTSLQLEGERERLHDTSQAAGAIVTPESSTAPSQTNDQVLLKLKRRF
jgi:hypothetical protein